VTGWEGINLTLYCSVSLFRQGFSPSSLLKKENIF
jgi:hypothetical protein